MKLVTADLVHEPMVEPSSVLAYLRTGAWVKLDEHRLDGRHVVTLFEHQSRQVEVHVPVWPGARDYPRLLAHAINTIALAERRPTLALLSDLRAAHCDVLRVRAGDVPLSLGRGVAVLSAIRTLLTTAATGLGYRPVAVGDPLLARVDALLDQITLGLPEPGSAAVRVLVPVSSEVAASPEAVPYAAEAEPRPLGRRITEALATMVLAAQQAAEAAAVDGSLEAFVARGVSAEVCRTLASAGAPLTIEIGWALTMPRSPVAAMTLSAELVSTLADAALRLPSATPPPS